MTAEFIKVCSPCDLPEGTVKVFVVQGKRIALCHTEGKFYAVADLCSHDDGPLGEGELSDHMIECPRHGARFDIKTGKALCLPAVRPIPAYEVELRDGELFVGICSHD